MRHFLVADNQDIARQGIISLLNEFKLSESISEIKDRNELQQKLSIHPDAVVILDYTLFDFSSSQQLLIAKEKFPHSAWILFSDDLSKQFLRQLLIVDSSFCVIMKHASKTEILAALQAATENTSYICDFALTILEGGIVNPNHAKDKLTASEKTILHEIALGKTTKEIAWEKNLSFHTVNSHRKNIFRKLEVNNVHEAVKYAIRSGIIDVMEYYI